MTDDGDSRIPREGGMDYYLDLFQQYREGKKFIHDRIALVKEWLLADQPDPLLEVACGIGYCALELARASRGRVVAFDLAAEPLRFLQRLPARPANLGLFRGDLCRTPFRARTFAAINFSEAVEHLPEPRAGLREMRRILRPDGRLLVSTWPNRQNFSVARGARKGHDFSPVDFNKQSPASLARLLRESGFVIERRRLMNHYFQVPKTRLILDNLSGRQGPLRLIEELLERTLPVNPLAPWLANSIYYRCRPA